MRKAKEINGKTVNQIVEVTLPLPIHLPRNFSQPHLISALKSKVILLITIHTILCFFNQIFLHFHLEENTRGLWGLFDPVILKHNHRQGNNSKWTNVLNRFREGIVNDDDFELLKGRVTQDPCLDLDSMHLMYTNEEFQGHNDSMLNLLPRDLLPIPANKMYPKGRKPMIQKDGRIENRLVLDILKIKIGARCILTVNLNTVDDLVNGASGTILALKYKGNDLDCIIIKFDNPKCGQMHRERYSVISEMYKSDNGTPIFRHEYEIQLSSRKGKNLGMGSVAKVHQFPLFINYGSTAHKIQVHTTLLAKFQIYFLYGKICLFFLFRVLLFHQVQKLSLIGIKNLRQNKMLV